jgi:hypothetical protein
MTVKTSFIANIPFPSAAGSPKYQGQGQNGRVLMTGLILTAYAGYPFLTLNAITSRGEASKSSGFEIVYDKKTLMALADVLTHFSQAADAQFQEVDAGHTPGLPAMSRADVAFPPVTDPERWPMARGRYKRSFVSALELSINPTLQAITIRPYNSKGRLTPFCSLEVAFDPKTLQALADGFTTIAKDAP